MTDRRYTLSRHAEDMLREREIAIEWVERALERPDVIERDPERENVYRAFATIGEREGRILRVVYAQDDGGVRVITAFFDRARRT